MGLVSGGVGSYSLCTMGVDNSSDSESVSTVLSAMDMILVVSGIMDPRTREKAKRLLFNQCGNMVQFPELIRIGYDEFILFMPEADGRSFKTINLSINGIVKIKDYLNSIEILDID